MLSSKCRLLSVTTALPSWPSYLHVHQHLRPLHDVSAIRFYSKGIVDRPSKNADALNLLIAAQNSLNREAAQGLCTIHAMATFLPAHPSGGNSPGLNRKTVSSAFHTIHEPTNAKEYRRCLLDSDQGEG